MITNKTRRAICNSGNMARRIEFNTICKPARKKKFSGSNISESEQITRMANQIQNERERERETCAFSTSTSEAGRGKIVSLLGTPLTSFNGRITRKARRDLTSKPWTLYWTNITLRKLEKGSRRVSSVIFASPSVHADQLPDDHDDEIEKIPTATQVSVRVQTETVGNDL